MICCSPGAGINPPSKPIAWPNGTFATQVVSPPLLIALHIGDPLADAIGLSLGHHRQDGEHQLADAIAAEVAAKIEHVQADGFARRYRLPVATVRDWEQGRSIPDAPALALLRAIGGEPEVLARVLEA